MKNDEQLIKDAYIRMYEGMMAKDEQILREVLDDSFVLVHMTGMRQSKDAFSSRRISGILCMPTSSPNAATKSGSCLSASAGVSVAHD